MDLKEEREQLNMICQGCLAADRKVRQINGEMSNLFYVLKNDKLNEQRVKLKLCWECIAFLVKIKRFQVRIQTAQCLLLQYMQYFNDKDVFPKVSSVSSLKRFHTNTFNYEFYEADKNNLAVLNNINVYKDKDENKDLIDEYFEERKEETAEELLSDIKLECSNSIKEEYNDINDSDYYEPLLKSEQGEFVAEKASTKKYKKYKYDILAIVTKRKDLSKKNYMDYAEPILLDQKEYEKVSKRIQRRLGYPRMPFKCVECKQGYLKKLDLQRHDSFFHSDKLTFPHKCASCSTMLISLEHQSQHWADAHSRSYHKCTICSEVHLSNEIKVHIKLKHRNNYKCKECGYDCCGLSAFRSHYKNEHERAICDHCNMEFSKKKTLIRHIRFIHTAGYCNICDRVYRNLKTLKSHNQVTHPELTSGETRAELSYCVECNKQYPSVYKYRRHLLESPRHTMQKKIRVPCPDCGKVFTRTNFMKNHYKFAHLKVTKNHCEQCDKYYTTGYGLRKHIATFHKKIAPVKDKYCDLCGRGFSTNRILENHRRTHTGERPYQCKYCPAAFAQEIAMKSHQKSQHKNFELPS